MAKEKFIVVKDEILAKGLVELRRYNHYPDALAAVRRCQKVMVIQHPSYRDMFIYLFHIKGGLWKIKVRYNTSVNRPSASQRIIDCVACKLTGE